MTRYLSGERVDDVQNLFDLHFLVPRKDWQSHTVATPNFGRGRKNSIGVARGGSGGFVPIIDGKLRGKNGLLRGRMFVLIFEH